MASTKKKPARQTVRSDARHNFWTAKAPPLEYGREQFRFRVSRRRRRLPPLNIDPWVEHANWQRDGSKRTAEINFRRPLGEHTATMIASGDEVLCEVATFGSAGGWRLLWRLKVATPNHQIREGIMSVALASSLDPLTKSKVAWKFRKSRAKPHGWTADEITRSACARFGVKIGRLPRGRHRITKLVDKSLSAHDVIVQAWKIERENTGRRFDVDFSTGVLNITELRTPRYMLLLGPAIIDAAIEQSFGGLATAIIAIATKKDRGQSKARKLRVTVVDQNRRRRYGHIVKTLRAPRGIDTLAELRKWAKSRLARTHKPYKAVTFTHPGLPLVDRGDAVRLRMPDADFNALVFVTSARHDLSAGSYTMQLTVSFSDPYADIRKERAKKKRAAAAARRGRQSRDEHTPPKPRRARSREHA